MVKKFLITILTINFYLASPAYCQISLIRDAQSEKLLKELSEPIFLAANLHPDNIKIHIVNDQNLNAFVSGGHNIFINIGLITKYSKPNGLIGVISHETGHIKAGHLARSKESYENANNTMLLSYLLGIGAVLAGSPDVGMAAIMGGQDMAQRLFLKYNRSQEESADYHALKYLKKIKYPANGLVKLLQDLSQKSPRSRLKIHEYLLTHPISEKRIELILQRTKNNNFSDAAINSKLQRQLDIVIKKLEGFTFDPAKIIKKYKNKNDELSKYIKSIAYFRNNNLEKSLNLLNELINTSKNSEEKGFLYELKGQILFENNYMTKSIIAYDKAIKYLDDNYNSQAKIAFSSAILHIDDQDLLKLGAKRLNEAKKFENSTPLLFLQLSKIQNKLQNKAKSYLALAQYNFLIKKYKISEKYAKKAKKYFKKTNKIEILIAEDIIELSKNNQALKNH